MDFPFKNLSSADALAEIEALQVAHERKALQNFIQVEAKMPVEETWQADVAIRDDLEAMRKTISDQVQSEKKVKDDAEKALSDQVLANQVSSNK